VIGYVWPGGGQNAYDGFPNVAGANLAPGYQSPYPGGNPTGAVAFGGGQMYVGDGLEVDNGNSGLGADLLILSKS
jgi:hypothetical protein